MTIINEKQAANDPIVGCAYVFVNEIEAETQVGASRVAITLISGKEWKPIYFTPGSALLTSTGSSSFVGSIVENKFEMKVPGGSSDLTSEITRLCGRSIVLKLTLESGAVLVCGGKARKLRILSVAQVGTQNGYVLSFVYKSNKEFLWLD